MPHWGVAITETDSDMKETAELYRLDLQCGYFAVADAVGWADAVLAEEEHPEYAVIEVAMAGGERLGDAARHFYPLAHGADTGARKRDLLTLLRRDLMRDRSKARRVARAVMMLGKAANDEALHYRGDGWDDELYLAESGTYGSVATTVDEMLSEMDGYGLSQYAKDEHARKSEA